MQDKHLSKPILVAGGAGFIGTHLCKRLLTEGHHVICLDNFQTGSHDNIAALQHNPRFRLIQQDVIRPVNVEVDQIYNLASPASSLHYQQTPVQTTLTNVLGASNLLELARRNGATILQASTSEVYGDPLVQPQHEAYWGNVNPVGPRSCYDEGKRCAETLFFDHQRQYGTRIRVARIFNTYGPGMHPEDGRVVPNFIRQALANKPITLYGDGSQSRSFCYVDDLVDGLVRLMNTQQDMIGPINLGNPVELTMQELAARILVLTGSTSIISPHPLPTDDPRQRRPDISLAKQLLGWQPATSLDIGLKRTIAYFNGFQP